MNGSFPYFEDEGLDDVGLNLHDRSSRKHESARPNHRLSQRLVGGRESFHGRRLVMKNDLCCLPQDDELHCLGDHGSDHRCQDHFLEDPLVGGSKLQHGSESPTSVIAPLARSSRGQMASLQSYRSGEPCEFHEEYPPQIPSISKPEYFGRDIVKDALSPHGQLESKPAAKPGVQFCGSRHDVIADKIAAFDTSDKSKKPVSNKMTVEIAPGVHARLRGAEETWNAVQNDFYLPTQCFCCSLDLCCIMDASFVLCPECKVVSPVPGCDSITGEGGSLDGGVGLGFTFDDLQKWQTDIIRQHQQF